MTSPRFIIATLCVFALFDTVYSHQQWICYGTEFRQMNKTISKEFGDGYVNHSKCGAVCPSHNEPSNDQWVGYVGAIIAIVFFGTNFVPIKKFDTGDGIFFQWILCVGIWIVGLIVNLIQGQPPFFYPSLIGGFLWSFGNLFTVAIIKMIGLTMGLTVWGATNLLSGWISGRFILKEHLECPGLNYAGVCCVIVSTVVLAFVKSEGKKITSSSDQQHHPSERAPLINSARHSNERSSSLSGSILDKILNRGDSGAEGTEGSDIRVSFNSNRSSFIAGTTDPDIDTSWVDRLAKWPKRILGFSMALCVGFFFGLQFLGVEYMRLCDDELHTCNELDYIFGQYTGILLSSTIWFIIYCIIKKNKPQVYPKLIIPGLISGIMWGVAMVGWFLANQHLSLAVSFPIVTAGPGFVSSALGILVFREIKGWLNILLYFGGFSITVIGLVLVGLSSCKVHC